MKWYTWKFWRIAKGVGQSNYPIDRVMDADGTWKPFYKNYYWVTRKQHRCCQH